MVNFDPTSVSISSTNLGSDNVLTNRTFDILGTNFQKGLQLSGIVTEITADGDIIFIDSIKEHILIPSNKNSEIGDKIILELLSSEDEAIKGNIFCKDKNNISATFTRLKTLDLLKVSNTPERHIVSKIKYEGIDLPALSAKNITAEAKYLNFKNLNPNTQIYKNLLEANASKGTKLLIQASKYSGQEKLLPNQMVGIVVDNGGDSSQQLIKTNFGIFEIYDSKLPANKSLIFNIIAIDSKVVQLQDINHIIEELLFSITSTPKILLDIVKLIFPLRYKSLKDEVYNEEIYIDNADQTINLKESDILTNQYEREIEDRKNIYKSNYIKEGSPYAKNKSFYYELLQKFMNINEWSSVSNILNFGVWYSFPFQSKDYIENDVDQNQIFIKYINNQQIKFVVNIQPIALGDIRLEGYVERDKNMAINNFNLNIKYKNKKLVFLQLDIEQIFLNQKNKNQIKGIINFEHVGEFTSIID